MRGSSHLKRIEKIKEEEGVSTKDINMIIDLFYDGIRDKVDKIKQPSRNDLNEEEFDKEMKSFSFPGIGILRPSYKMYLRLNQKIKEKTK